MLDLAIQLSLVKQKEPGYSPGSFQTSSLQPVIDILGGIAGTGLEEIVVRLDIGREIDNLPCFQLPGGIQYNRTTVMVCAFKVSRQTDVANIFAALRRIGRRNFV